MRYAFIAILLLIFPCAAKANGEDLELFVKIVGGEKSEGQAIVTLFDSEESYMTTPLNQKFVAIDQDGIAQVSFPGLAKGEYALSIVYDQNADGTLDTNFLGIPTEKVAFSNGAEASFGPASYDDAKFTLSSDRTNMTISFNGDRKEE